MISINHPYPKGYKNEEKATTSAPTYTFAAAPANSGTRIKKDANEEMKNAAGSSGPASVDEVYYEPGSPTTGSGSPSPSRSTASTSAYQSAATSQHGPIGRGDSSFSCSSGGLKGVVGSVGSDSDSESDSDCSYSSSPLFTSCLPKQVKSKWEILDNTEHNSLDKMDGVTTAATSCSKQGKNMTRSCVLGRDDKDRRLSDSSADDVDDDVTRQEGAAAVAGPSTTKGEVSSSYTSKRETIEDFLNSCGDYLQRQPTDKSGKKRVRWADVEERREIEQEKRLGFIVGRTNWHRLMNEDEATTAALTKTKFI